MSIPFSTRRRMAVTIAVLLCAAGAATAQDAPLAVGPAQAFDPTIGIRLPPGFRATVFADNLGRARHLVVRDNGDVYVMVLNREDGGIIALRDTDGDGRADVVRPFGDQRGTGIDIQGRFLYVASNTAVHRYRLAAGSLVPEGDPETVVSGFPVQRSHAAKTIALDDRGNLYVNVGAPSNSCQERDRQAGAKGMMPCPELDRQAGIWRFAAGHLDQTQERDGHRFATGVRNAVAIAWDTRGRALYMANHGRDQLAAHWSAHYDEQRSAELPAEEFHRLRDGGDYGWPYTYYDQLVGQRMVAPEYGGDGRTPAPAGRYETPLVAFPGHWAPNDLLFYGGRQFPSYFQGGAFIAFHGSWNRAPLEQQGFKVTFVPLAADGRPGPWTVFADGFPGATSVANPREATFRPMGLAEGPDGALYVSDSQKGRVWRIVYRAP